MKATRRDFAKTLAVAPLAALAQTEEKKPSALGHAMTEVVRSTYGQHLTSEEIKTIDKVLDEYGPYIEEFRKYKLANSDEPDFIFRA
jgi:hypothetical protein